MIFRPSSLEGAFLLEPERIEDERGHFARTFSVEDFLANGLDPVVRQGNTSFNLRAGTLRGMHFQTDPHGETKLVRCTRGAIFDVIVDLRPASDTFTGWFGAELSAANGNQLFVPVGFAHGFQTLEDESEVAYLMGHDHVPGAGRGVRFDDPAFGIAWPDPPAGDRTMSDRDRTYPDFAG